MCLRITAETSEIDVVLLRRKGIFVIESKITQAGFLVMKSPAYWTAMLRIKVKSFYNPYKTEQSTHIKWLGQYLQNSVPFVFCHCIFRSGTN